MRETTFQVARIIWYILNFNPRPPCGRRLQRALFTPCLTRFQPTSPVRETTASGPAVNDPEKISTHVPRAGDDHNHVIYAGCRSNFNPRPPCGRRRVHLARRIWMIVFQPTSPVRETTDKGHTPGVGGTNFNPRPPCGRRRCNRDLKIAALSISTHVPRAGDDQISG